MLPLSILQYFRPTLSDNWYWKPNFSLFEYHHFTKGLLYKQGRNKHCQSWVDPEVGGGEGTQDILENLKVRYVSLELLVQTPLKK